ncbi:hypothetical protein MD484_g8163, partial [Candolleomyces efflorescens]
MCGNVGLDERAALFRILKAGAHERVDVIARAMIYEVLKTNLIVVQATLDVLLDSAGD